MENSEWVSYKISVRDRLKAFSLEELNLSELIPETTRGRVINYQLTKSGTSVYANYRAAFFMICSTSYSDTIHRFMQIIERHCEQDQRRNSLANFRLLWKKQMRQKCG